MLVQRLAIHAMGRGGQVQEDGRRLSFRAQEGPLRRSNSGASLLEIKQEALASPLPSPQQSLPSPQLSPQASPNPTLLMSPPSGQTQQPSSSVTKMQRPPLSPTKKRPKASSRPHSPEHAERARKDEQPSKQTLTLQPAPKRSLADLLKMDEERCTAP